MMNYWWCNQGRQWEYERPAQVVCSSEDTKNPTYRKTVGDAAKGDLVVHYRRPHVVAISRCKQAGRYYLWLPAVSGQEYGSGWQFQTDYFDLGKPLHRERFAKLLVPMRTPHYPVDRTSRIRQGYFFPFDQAGFNVIVQAIWKEIPDWAKERLFSPADP